MNEALEYLVAGGVVVLWGLLIFGSYIHEVSKGKERNDDRN